MACALWGLASSSQLHVCEMCLCYCNGSICPFSLLYNVLSCGSAMTCAPLSLDGHLDSLPLGLCDKVADEHCCSLPLMHMCLHICWFCA